MAKSKTQNTLRYPYQITPYSPYLMDTADLSLQNTRQKICYGYSVVKKLSLYMRNDGQIEKPTLLV
eukprot:scaffold175249_cov30-Cyclotella_meneghiniana.AAC.1